MEHDLSIWGLFLAADIVVKTVMVLLILGSVWCWALILDKLVRLRIANRRADKFEEQFWSGGNLEALYDRVGDDPDEAMASVFAAGMREWRASAQRMQGKSNAPRPGLIQRIERVMQIAQGRAMGRLERGMTFLASLGSTAPFIGLFGTVWGIMNAFIAIAASADTSLAVVAPGIAEALFATALGLVAAIPAAAAYNKFSTDLARFGDRLDSFGAEFATILSRYVDERS